MAKKAKNTGLGVSLTDDDFLSATQDSFTPKGTVLISGADYFNFNERPEFIGTYTGEHHDDEGKLIGFNFMDRDGNDWLITNSYVIEKALDTVLTSGKFKGKKVRETGAELYIKFLGQKKLGNGQPFNKYKVVLLDHE